MYKAETFTRPLSVDPAAGCGRPSVPASADGMSNCSFAEMLGGKEAQWTVAKRQAVLLCFRSRRACSQFCTGDGNLTPGPGLTLTCYCMMAWWPSSLRLTPSTDSAGIQGQRPSSERLGCRLSFLSLSSLPFSSPIVWHRGGRG